LATASFRPDAWTGVVRWTLRVLGAAMLTVVPAFVVLGALFLAWGLASRGIRHAR